MVEDIVTTGLSSRECIAAIQAAGGEVVCAACIVDRSGGEADVGVPLVALATPRRPGLSRRRPAAGTGRHPDRGPGQPEAGASEPACASASTSTTSRPSGTPAAARYPDPVRAAELALAAGADGITAHLREDRRHISDADIDGAVGHAAASAAGR